MILEKILNNLKCCGNNILYQSAKEEVTYNEMLVYVRNLYNFLIGKKQNNKENRIIVYGHKEKEMIVSFLACSFAGITYIPIDISIGKQRLKKIIEITKPMLVITTNETADKIEYEQKIDSTELLKIINIEDDEKEIKQLMKKEDIYYIIFTSGTTGEPKGVKITYENINSFCTWFENIVKLNKTVVLNQARFSFDLSVADVYYTLLTGSKLVITESNTNINLLELFEWLNKNKDIEFIVCTPTFLELLLCDKNFNNSFLPNLKLIYFCGEILRRDVVSKIFGRFSDIRIINSYGPTECTVAVTSIEIYKDNMDEKISVGIPKNDVEVDIVDENNKIVADGKTGQIIISGKSVALGYLNGTNSNFIDYKGARAYLTGDIGYKLKNRIYYLYRKDSQIKYKGYRIELMDIENSLYKLNYIDKVLVKTKKNASNDVIRIIAYVVLKKDGIEKLQIKEDLNKLLPYYMVPDIMIVDTLSMNINGKKDVNLNE